MTGDESDAASAFSGKPGAMSAFSVACGRASSYAPVDRTVSAVCEPIHLDKVTIAKGRMLLELSLDGAAIEPVSAKLATKVQTIYSQIRMRTCINAQGSTFGKTIVGTSIPHLFEHIALEEQLSLIRDNEMLANMLGDRLLIGTSRISKDRHRGEVELSFVDDIICAQAVRKTLDTLNELLT